MTRLSVNVNKVATLRNARGGNQPDVVAFARACERLGAQGITVHPRPDERHIRYSDVYALKPVVGTEFNIEGNPRGERDRRGEDGPYGFIDLVKDVRPAQVTLVPDADGALTSNAGWNTVRHQGYLHDVATEFKACGIRVSIFVDADRRMVEHAAAAGADRVELYTASYAEGYASGRERAIAPFVAAAEAARQCGLGLNAGHDLSLDNLAYFHQRIPWLDEVSIGHALVGDCLYLGLGETLRRYLECLR